MLKEPIDVKCKRALKILKEVELADLVFKEFPHQEFIKAAKNLIRLLVLSGDFGLKETEVMLDCYKSNFSLSFIEEHTEIKAAINNLIVDLARYFSYPILQRVFEELKSIPLNLITMKYLSTIYSYTVNVLKNIKQRNEYVKSEKKKNKTISNDLLADNFKLYDYNVLWDIMTYSKTDVKVDTEIKDHASIRLVHILEETLHDCTELLKRAFNAIRHNSSSSIGCMKFVINCYKHLKSKELVKTLIKKNTSKESGLLNDIVTNFLNYKIYVNKSVDKQNSLLNLMLKVLFI